VSAEVTDSPENGVELCLTLYPCTMFERNDLFHKYEFDLNPILIATANGGHHDFPTNLKIR
jgi:hypothetical protein